MMIWFESKLWGETQHLDNSVMGSLNEIYDLCIVDYLMYLYADQMVNIFCSPFASTLWLQFHDSHMTVSHDGG